jgi:acyl dehydratase
MAVKQEMIGQALTPTRFEVERGKIREFATAIGDQNPIYHRVEAALEAGYSDLPIPPTFPTTFSFWGKPVEGQTGLTARDLGFPATGGLHGEEEYTYLAPIYPGDIVTGVRKLIDVKSREGKLGTMEIATLETVYTNQHGQEVLKVRSTVIFTGGAK